MTISPHLTRRGMLHTLLCLSAFGFTRLGVRTVSDSGGRDPLMPTLANFFAHKDSARVVGLEYLHSVPQEADAGLLVDLICASWGQAQRETTSLEPEQLRALLLQQQRHDFDRGQIVKVSGWILSETEARLCALAALV